MEKKAPFVYREIPVNKIVLENKQHIFAYTIYKTTFLITIMVETFS